jgi:hypothetical protein
MPRVGVSINIVVNGVIIDPGYSCAYINYYVLWFEIVLLPINNNLQGSN